MHVFLIGVHLIACITMIFIIVFQKGKGAEMGAVFGGGASQTAFGSTGPQSFLEKITVICAIVFMITSLSLAYLSSIKTAKFGETRNQPIEQPVQQQQQQPVQAPSKPAAPEAPKAPVSE
jgi:preprotein translocase subunit SecG